VKTLLSFMDNFSGRSVLWLSFIAVLLLGVASFYSVAEVPHEIFYFVPTTICSWYGSKRSGLLVSTFSVIVLFGVEVWRQGFDPLLLFTHLLPTLLGLSSLAVIVTNFRSVHRFESLAAHTDNLTGINNTRGFYTELTDELLRSVRYEHHFTLAFLDVDDFKSINDSLGHAVGDKLLKEVANCLKVSVRSTDVVGRLGGDEFAVLMPETEANQAKLAFENLLEALTVRMARHNWKVGFSIGVVTFERLPDDIKGALKAADDLMYSAKLEGKSKAKYRVWRPNYRNV
jgi:diguanylate cyclase (GGDEF)-like protein